MNNASPRLDDGRSWIVAWQRRSWSCLELRRRCGRRLIVLPLLGNLQSPETHAGGCPIDCGADVAHGYVTCALTVASRRTWTCPVWSPQPAQGTQGTQGTRRCRQPSLFGPHLYLLHYLLSDAPYLLLFKPCVCLGLNGGHWSALAYTVSTFFGLLHLSWLPLFRTGELRRQLCAPGFTTSSTRRSLSLDS